MKIAVQLTSQSIEIPPQEMRSRELGACIEFQGIVREMEDGNPLDGLFYEAYEPMAQRRMEQHLNELSASHPCMEVTLIHRLGWVPVGAASLYIRILSKHRGEGLAMLAEAVNRLKKDVPIWKLPAPP